MRHDVIEKPTPLEAVNWQFQAASCIRCRVGNIWGPPPCDCFSREEKAENRRRQRDACPECGESLHEPVDAFSECDTCEAKAQEANRRNSVRFGPISPLAQRLACDLHSERYTC